MTGHPDPPTPPPPPALPDLPERHYRFIAENCADAITHHELAGPVLWASPSCETVLGYPVAELIGTPFRARVHPEDLPQHAALIAGVVRGETALVDSRYRWRLPDGSWRWLHSRVQAVTGDDGPVRQTVAVTRNVDGEVRAELLLARAYEETASARALMETALDAMSEPFVVWSLLPDGSGDLRLEMANQAAERVLPGRRDDLLGRTLDELYLPRLAARAAATRVAVTAALRAGTSVVGSDFEVGEVEGHDPEPGALEGTRVFRPTISPVGEDRVAVVMRDVTEEMRAVRRLARERDLASDAARRDSLTGLFNRRGLQERLTAALGAGPAAVAFADLDRFKAVNDTYGHDAGDALLLAVAERLGRLVRAGDSVARLGGDEFVLVLRDLPTDWDAASFAERATAAVAAPVVVAPGAAVRPGASFGVVLVPPGDPRGPDEVLAAADREMYRVKTARRNLPVG